MKIVKLVLTTPTILYVIDDLGRGGAETLLVGLLPELRAKYKIVLVTLRDKNDFDKAALDGVVYHSLKVKSNIDFVGAVFKLRKLVKHYSPSIVHSHLLLSSIIAKAACPAKIPLVFSVHSELSKNAFEDSSILKLLEKITNRKTQTLIAVSNTVLEDYVRAMHFNGKKIVIENYIDDSFFIGGQPAAFVPGSTLKMVAVGNIKKAKNYKYLVESFRFLKELPVTLDIYGKQDSIIFPELQSIVSTNDLPVHFRGSVTTNTALLQTYDVFVMSSAHEGFGMAVVEAMASGLPVIISDLPVLREVSQGNAIFFNISDPASLADQIKKILQGRLDLSQMSLDGIDISGRYSKGQYLTKLESLYSELAGSR